MARNKIALVGAGNIGGELAQFQLAVPAASIQVFQGMLLFFMLAVDILVNFRIRLKKKEMA